MSSNMEQVFYRLHVRFTTTVTRILSPNVRKWMEYLSLAHAFALAIILVRLQTSFVNQRSHCLSRYFDSQGLDPYDTEVLQLRIVRPRGRRPHVSSSSWLKSVQGWGAGLALGECEVEDGEHSRCWIGSDSCFLPSDYSVERSFLFSFEKGFLMLRQQLRDAHTIRSLNVTIDAQNTECFGGQATQFLLQHLIGFDTVVMNWLISTYRGHGYLYTMQSKELFNLNYAAELMASSESWQRYAMFKAGVVLTTLFLFFTTTTLVSFTLRETQERMLKFTYLLQHYVRNRLPYGPLVLTHVVESLVFVPIMVGILLFLSEFFSDQLLAFMVLSMVWAAEVYSVITVRTPICVRFFPKLFFAYFVLFHIYFFSFPFGFSYLALISIVTFLQHSMLFFWNRYEVPALQSGQVSAENPRAAGVIISGPSIEELLLAAAIPQQHQIVAEGPDDMPQLPSPRLDDTAPSSLAAVAQPPLLPPPHRITADGSSSTAAATSEQGVLTSERSSTPSPPSPYSMFFASAASPHFPSHQSGLRGGPYASRYDQAAFLDAATRRMIQLGSQLPSPQTTTAAAAGLPPSSSSSSLRGGVLSGASSSEDLVAMESWLFGGGSSRGGRRWMASPSPVTVTDDAPAAVAGAPPPAISPAGSTGPSGGLVSSSPAVAVPPSPPPIPTPPQPTAAPPALPGQQSPSAFVPPVSASGRGGSSGPAPLVPRPMPAAADARPSPIRMARRLLGNVFSSQ